MKYSAICLLVFVGLSPTVADAAKPVCGDGNQRGGEQCDGADLDGQSCLSLGFDSGVLDCDAQCTFNTSGCFTTPTAVCGDGSVDNFEECDGLSDSACPGLCSAHCACPATGPGGLEIHVIDVGQGDAILIISPDGFTMLVDAGEEFAAPVIINYLTSIGVAGLDYTAVSHMHADHIGGMDQVIANYPSVVKSFDSGASFGTNEYSEYDTAAGSRRETVVKNQQLDLGPSTTVEVLHAYVGSSNENDNSVVVVVRHGGLSFLFGGDCEEACESELDPGHIDVYKVHHHGSNTSSSAP
ncbi:MAG: hypothetical protein ACI9OJ_003188, partial [Myxococcota bacterium]